MNAFVKDRSFDAFAKVVDRLLASPRYGERWGRHWLDVARYADEMYSSTEDAPSPNAWRYRDWVVKAFNEDMPYDTFLKAQIAGDLIDSKNKEKLIGGLGFFHSVRAAGRSRRCAEPRNACHYRRLRAMSRS